MYDLKMLKPAISDFELDVCIVFPCQPATFNLHLIMTANPFLEYTDNSSASTFYHEIQMSCMEILSSFLFSGGQCVTVFTLSLSDFLPHLL
jgi:hypothetical protein